MDKRRMSAREKRRKARQRQIIFRCSITCITVVAAIGVLIAGWNLIKSPKIVSGTTEVPEPVIEAQAQVMNDEQIKDTATTKTLAEGAESKYEVPGWQINDTGWWYEEEGNTYYVNGWKTINGVRYYFNEAGYMATGWNIIDGEDYYFDESGQVDETVQPKLVAMTFDDGPSAYTDHLLDVLEENNSKATFFMVGNIIEEHVDTVKRMANMGMELGNHTWDHTYLRNSTPEIMSQKFAQTDEVLKKIVGAESTVFRSPGGGENDEYRAIMQKPLILWKLDTLDWKTLDVDSNIEVVLDNVQDGDIVLMHDLHKTSVESCDTIIPELRKRGFKLVTVTELAQARGTTLEAGVDYYSFAPSKEEEKSESDSSEDQEKETDSKETQSKDTESKDTESKDTDKA